MKNIVFAAIGLLLSACATVPMNAPTYVRAADPPAGQSNLYIYRIGAYPTLRAPIIYVDDQPIISPAERAYTVVPLPVGTREVRVDWAGDTGWPDLKFPIEIEGRAPLYIKISGSFENRGSYYNAGSSARLVPQELAEPELLECCRYVRPIQRDN